MKDMPDHRSAVPATETLYTLEKDDRGKLFDDHAFATAEDVDSLLDLVYTFEREAKSQYPMNEIPPTVRDEIDLIRDLVLDQQAIMRRLFERFVEHVKAT